MRLKLSGQDPDQLRSMLVDWYFRPLAANLFQREAEVGAIFLLVRAGREGPAIHHLVAVADPQAQWPVYEVLPMEDQIEDLQVRYFGARGFELLEPHSFSVAVRPCCRWDGEWTPFVVLRRGEREPELLAASHRREEYWDAGIPMPGTGRTVEQVMDSLEMLDAGAQLLWRMELALDALEVLPNHPNEHVSAEWALKQLEWLLGPQEP